MKKVCKLFICFIFLFISFSFCACNKNPTIYCKGEISFEGDGLQGVILKADNKTYGETNADGNYNIECNADTITIYPEKQGYFFEPSSAVLVKGENSINFVAKKVTELNGTLSLKEIVINPTYIISYSDNYLYKNNNIDCLKAFNILLMSNNKSYSLISDGTFLYKNEDNIIPVEDELTITCGKQSQVGFLINTYFKYNNLESHTTSAEYSYLIISDKHTNEELINNQIKYKLVGINNSSNKFTFDITFVFDYIENSSSLV